MKDVQMSALKERDGWRARPSALIQESSEIIVLAPGIKNWIYRNFLLSAAVIRGGEHHFQVFMFCKVDRQMELDGNALYFMNVTLQKREKKKGNKRLW